MTFIDFVAAFDTVSHKFLDQALTEAGASEKVRGVFRAIYSAAIAHVRVRDAGGRVSQSKSFPVRRGVVQGDIFSPVCFVIALECLFRRCDSHGGLSLAGVWIERLERLREYADDAALVDVGYEMASRRVSELARKAGEVADMEVSVPKTEFMAVHDFAVSAAVAQDYEEQRWGHVCADCGRGFVCKHGLAVHRGKGCRLKGREE